VPVTHSDGGARGKEGIMGDRQLGFVCHPESSEAKHTT
jgi:hypothetical protein